MVITAAVAAEKGQEKEELPSRHKFHRSQILPIQAITKRYEWIWKDDLAQ